MLKNTLKVSVIIASLSACTEYKKHNDFSAFDAFKRDSEQGLEINCEDVINTKILKDAGLYFTLEYTDDVIDYIEYGGYSFKECSNISVMVDKYCDKSIDMYVNSFMNNSYGDEPTDEYKNVCGDKIIEKFKLVNHSYVLPTKENKFVVLNNIGQMFDPKAIVGLSFSYEQPYLWLLTIKTKDESFNLYWGDEKLWEKAKLDFAKIATENTQTQI